MATLDIWCWGVKDLAKSLPDVEITITFRKKNCVVKKGVRTNMLARVVLLMLSLFCVSFAAS